jgi:hypothetical protein
MLWVVVAVAVIEVVVACFLVWGWCVLNSWDKRLLKESQECYACVTGASVTSFNVGRSSSFCREHKAHSALIYDLEEKERRAVEDERRSGRL